MNYMYLYTDQVNCVCWLDESYFKEQFLPKFVIVKICDAFTHFQEHVGLIRVHEI